MLSENTTSKAGARQRCKPEPLSKVPPALADVALIDANTAAAGGSMSVSWWHAEVKAKRAPSPVVKGKRCTRWRLADVRAFWASFAPEGVTQ